MQSIQHQHQPSNSQSANDSQQSPEGSKLRDSSLIVSSLRYNQSMRLIKQYQEQKQSREREVRPDAFSNNTQGNQSLLLNNLANKSNIQDFKSNSIASTGTFGSATGQAKDHFNHERGIASSETQPETGRIGQDSQPRRYITLGKGSSQTVNEMGEKQVCDDLKQETFSEDMGPAPQFGINDQNLSRIQQLKSSEVDQYSLSDSNFQDLRYRGLTYGTGTNSTPIKKFHPVQTISDIEHSSPYDQDDQSQMFGNLTGLGQSPDPQQKQINQKRFVCENQNMIGQSVYPISQRQMSASVQSPNVNYPSQLHHQGSYQNLNHRIGANAHQNVADLHNTDSNIKESPQTPNTNQGQDKLSCSAYQNDGHTLDSQAWQVSLAKMREEVLLKQERELMKKMQELAYHREMVQRELQRVQQDKTSALSQSLGIAGAGSAIHPSQVLNIQDQQSIDTYSNHTVISHIQATRNLGVGTGFGLNQSIQATPVKQELRHQSQSSIGGMVKSNSEYITPLNYQSIKDKNEKNSIINHSVQNQDNKNISLQGTPPDSLKTEEVKVVPKGRERSLSNDEYAQLERSNNFYSLRTANIKQVIEQFNENQSERLSTGEDRKLGIPQVARDSNPPQETPCFLNYFQKVGSPPQELHRNQALKLSNYSSTNKNNDSNYNSRTMKINSKALIDTFNEQETPQSQFASSSKQGEGHPHSRVNSVPYQTRFQVNTDSSITDTTQGDLRKDIEEVARSLARVKAAEEKLFLELERKKQAQMNGLGTAFQSFTQNQNSYKQALLRSQSPNNYNTLMNLKKQTQSNADQRSQDIHHGAHFSHGINNNQQLSEIKETQFSFSSQSNDQNNHTQQTMGNHEQLQEQVSQPSSLALNNGIIEYNVYMGTQGGVQRDQNGESEVQRRLKMYQQMQQRHDYQREKDMIINAYLHHHHNANVPSEGLVNLIITTPKIVEDVDEEDLISREGSKVQRTDRISEKHETSTESVDMTKTHSVKQYVSKQKNPSDQNKHSAKQPTRKGVNILDSTDEAQSCQQQSAQGRFLVNCSSQGSIQTVQSVKTTQSQQVPQSKKLIKPNPSNQNPPTGQGTSKNHQKVLVQTRSSANQSQSSAASMNQKQKSNQDQNPHDRDSRVQQQHQATVRTIYQKNEQSGSRQQQIDNKDKTQSSRISTGVKYGNNHLQKLQSQESSQMSNSQKSKIDSHKYKGVGKTYLNDTSMKSSVSSNQKVNSNVKQSYLQNAPSRDSQINTNHHPQFLIRDGSGNRQRQNQDKINTSSQQNQPSAQQPIQFFSKDKGSPVRGPNAQWISSFTNSHSQAAHSKLNYQRNERSPTTRPVDSQSLANQNSFLTNQQKEGNNIQFKSSCQEANIRSPQPNGRNQVISNRVKNSPPAQFSTQQSQSSQQQISNTHRSPQYTHGTQPQVRTVYQKRDGSQGARDRSNGNTSEGRQAYTTSHGQHAREPANMMKKAALNGSKSQQSLGLGQFRGNNALQKKRSIDFQNPVAINQQQVQVQIQNPKVIAFDSNAVLAESTLGITKEYQQYGKRAGNQTNVDKVLKFIATSPTKNLNDRLNDGRRKFESEEAAGSLISQNTIVSIQGYSGEQPKVIGFDATSTFDQSAPLINIQHPSSFSSHQPTASLSGNGGQLTFRERQNSPNGLRITSQRQSLEFSKQPTLNSNQNHGSQSHSQIELNSPQEIQSSHSNFSSVNYHHEPNQSIINQHHQLQTMSLDQKQQILLQSANQSAIQPSQRDSNRASIVNYDSQEIAQMQGQQIQNLKESNSLNVLQYHAHAQIKSSAGLSLNASQSQMGKDSILSDMNSSKYEKYQRGYQLNTEMNLQQQHLPSEYEEEDGI